jgi:cytochrome P450
MYHQEFNMSATRCESDVDLFSDEALQDPYPLYKALRALAGAVWMKPLQMFALSRFDDVREALRNWRVFSSARGVAMNEPINQAIAGNTLGSDPPLHNRFRNILVKPMLTGMPAVTELLESEAERLAERLCTQGRFDAATELAQYLPITVISHLVGLPEEGRERMLEWGNAAFNSLGPSNQRCASSTQIAMGLVDYALNKLDARTVKRGSWASMAFEAAERGEITLQQARGLILDYVAPSLDTTIFAISNAIWLFARHPDQWSALCANPASMPGAINEVLRVESPIQAFSRFVTQDTQVDGVSVPQGSRVIVLYGSANRDERKWEDPERFDIQRKAAEQLAFGHGEHLCVGLPLARLEIKVVLSALARRVKRFELLGMRRGINNTLRGIEHLQVAIH